MILGTEEDASIHSGSRQEVRVEVYSGVALLHEPYSWVVRLGHKVEHKT